MTCNKLEYKKNSDNYLIRNEILCNNMKTTYFLDMKNIFKPYIIDVLCSMINIRMQHVISFLTLPSLFSRPKIYI